MSQAQPQEPENRCSECYEPFNEETDLTDVLEHWIAEHSDTETFWDVVDGTETPVGCRSCHSVFDPTIRAERQGMALSAITFEVRQYCDDCEEARSRFDSLPNRVWRTVEPDELLKLEGQ